VRPIGVLMPFAVASAQYQTRIGAFLHGLHDLGWIDGRNMQVEYRASTGNPEEIRKYATELVALVMARPCVISNHLDCCAVDTAGRYRAAQESRLRQRSGLECSHFPTLVEGTLQRPASERRHSSRNRKPLRPAEPLHHLWAQSAADRSGAKSGSEPPITRFRSSRESL
jgi:hypothetical protein